MSVVGIVLCSIVFWFLCGLVASRRAYTRQVRYHNGRQCPDGKCMPPELAFWAGSIALAMWLIRDASLGLAWTLVTFTKGANVYIRHETRLQRDIRQAEYNRELRRKERDRDEAIVEELNHEYPLQMICAPGTEDGRCGHCVGCRNGGDLCVAREGLKLIPKPEPPQFDDWMPGPGRSLRRPRRFDVPVIPGPDGWTLPPVPPPFDFANCRKWTREPADIRPYV